MGVNVERLRRMFPGEDDHGGAMPVANIERVPRPLFHEITGEEVVVKILPDRLVVSTLYAEDVQEQAINRAISSLVPE